MVQFYKKLILGLLYIIIPIISNSQDFKIVGYLTNWNAAFANDAAKVDYSMVTHINIAFINPINAKGDLSPTNGLSTVVNTIHTNNKKVLISMGGAQAYSTFPKWPTLINPTNRGAFISKIMTFLNTYNIDGVDIDLEGDNVDLNYNPFVAQLSDSLKAKNKLFTAALGTWFASQITNATLNKFDWINSMAYDAYGTWTGAGDHSTVDLAQNQLNYWTSRGISYQNVVLGVPFYGYRWETDGNSSLSYDTIVTNWPRATTKDTIITTTGGYISYNGIPTIKEKTAMAIEQAAGIMIWTLQYDLPTTNPNSLLLAINEVINEYSGNIPPTVKLTSPSGGNTFKEGDTIVLSADASDSDGTIVSVSFYSGSTFLGESKSAPYTINWAPGPGTYQIYAKARDNVPGTSISSTILITVNAITVQEPFLGKPWSIPGKVEVEGFDIGENLGYYDTDATNNGGAYRSTSVDIEICTDIAGGYSIGYVKPTEWLEYTTAVAKDSIYDIEIRYASNNFAGGSLALSMDGVDLAGTIKINSTAGWQTWKSLTIPNIDLSQGNKILRIDMVSGEFNLNYVSFTYHKSTTAIISKDESVSNISFYPNPFTDNGTIKLDVKNSGLTQVSIIDLTGKELVHLSESYLTEGTNYINVEGSQLPKGFYLCRIIQNDRQLAIPIKKQ